MVRGSPAERAGIVPGDILVAVAGKAVTNTGDMLNLIAGLAPGAKTPLTVVRKGRETTVDVTVGRRPRQAT